MDIKNDILWRVYLCYIVVIFLAIAVLAKTFYIQQTQGAEWRKQGDKVRLKTDTIFGERGSIYSEDGQVLSTTVPEYDVYIDFMAYGMLCRDSVKSKKHSGKKEEDTAKSRVYRDSIKRKLDTLSTCLASLFADKTAKEYCMILHDGYKTGKRYFLLKKNINVAEHKEMKTFPLAKEKGNIGGFIFKHQYIRHYTYPSLAYRTVGRYKEDDSKGIENFYDSILRGSKGWRLYRDLGDGGVQMPIEQVEAQDGTNIVTTLDMNMQEIATTALKKMMISTQATNGCAIVMEVKTGKIKAMANLGRNSVGGYEENYNYAVQPSDPGSTFKLPVLLSLLEDGKVKIDDRVNLRGGRWTPYSGITIKDDHIPSSDIVTIQRAFETSSNVGMAWLTNEGYGKTPWQFIRYLQKMGFDSITKIDLTGEKKPTIHKPGNKLWSNVTLVKMSHGYGLTITPLQTITFYNAVANNGVMMRPYLVNMPDKPMIVNSKIAKDTILKQLVECLTGACHSPGSTAYSVFKNSAYPVAGKTGTAEYSNENGYENGIYHASFAGFFPADNPKYTCIVVIQNKPNTDNYYGSTVAAPVFKEIADKIYAKYIKKNYTTLNEMALPKNADSSLCNSKISEADAKIIFNKLNIPFVGSANDSSQWVKVDKQPTGIALTPYLVSSTTMPPLNGMGLKDAIYACEKMGLKVKITGKGKVRTQSITMGQSITKGQVVEVVLN